MKKLPIGGKLHNFVCFRCCTFLIQEEERIKKLLTIAKPTELPSINKRLVHCHGQIFIIIILYNVHIYSIEYSVRENSHAQSTHVKRGRKGMEKTRIIRNKHNPIICIVLLDLDLLKFSINI